MPQATLRSLSRSDAATPAGRRRRGWTIALAALVVGAGAGAAHRGYESLDQRSTNHSGVQDAVPGTAPEQPPSSRRQAPQPGGLVYRASSPALAYARPGALVVAGRDNYRDEPFQQVSAAGGTVLIYLDPVIDNPHGRYHELLHLRSACGPAVGRWPGEHRANKWGHLADFRPGSVLQQKLECVLDAMVRENPHMAGWFADDVGTRSWFPDIDWETFPDKDAYREGAVELTRTFRRVADRHGMIFLVNGTWSADDGGGYPDPDTHGNALADGGVVEHHDGELAYFGPYGCSGQWAADSPVTEGDAVTYAVTSSPSGTQEYVDSGCFAYVGQQRDYGRVEPWGAFHPTGLPSTPARP